ncbi:MAG: sirohydrochlorin cobaltochelatase [Eubacterium sp.]|nr:sirohydrochlorin cobaltochelatase [Eubacterium sp.]MCH4046278.1 sirohydrochlorin cobaltochelatase [Eubacterium sp.]MCH4079373.1 sirohydrochlorin cobaltochelatase [Eubacterium sp.]MCI1307476.1 sirohydrochlorin cobaltochelatase [Eubacterium sp.]MCI1405994.1 sirohydrochlorin cobaltochelatase [Eubacterium sp.]
MKKQSLKKFMTLALSAALASSMLLAVPAFADTTQSTSANAGTTAATDTAAQQTTEKVTITKDNVKEITGKITQMTLEQGKAFVDENDCPLLVAGLIGEIYIHPKSTPAEQEAQTEMIAKVAKVAKYAYNKLSAADKKAVPEIPDGYEYPGAGGADYFSTAAPIGSAAKDKAWTKKVCAAPTKKSEILVVSFGTSFNTSRYQTIGGIEKAINNKYGKKYSVRRAFTSQVIINHILVRDEYRIDTVREAMEKANKAGVKTLIVQPTTLMSGEEYDLLKENVKANKGSIKTIKIASPLLKSDKDRKTVAKALAVSAAKKAGVKTETLKKAGSRTAFVFIGHGTSHANQITYTRMQNDYTKLGYKNVFVGTVEGKPAATSCTSLIKKLKKKGYKKVVIRGMMVVAGDHANNDIAGNDADSWKTQLKKAGFKVSAQIEGLGSLKTVQNIYVQHTAAVIK